MATRPGTWKGTTAIYAAAWALATLVFWALSRITQQSMSILTSSIFAGLAVTAGELADRWRKKRRSAGP